MWLGLQRSRSATVGHEADDTISDMTKQASQIIDGRRNAIALPARHADVLIDERKQMLRQIGRTVWGRLCRAFESAGTLAPCTSSAWLCTTTKKRSNSV